MAQKGKREFLLSGFRVPLSVTRIMESPVTDFHRNRRGFGIDSVLQQLPFHNGGGAFNYPSPVAIWLIVF